MKEEREEREGKGLKEGGIEGREGGKGIEGREGGMERD